MKVHYYISFKVFISNITNSSEWNSDSETGISEILKSIGLETVTGLDPVIFPSVWQTDGNITKRIESALNFITQYNEECNIFLDKIDMRRNIDVDIKVEQKKKNQRNRGHSHCKNLSSCQSFLTKTLTATVLKGVISFDFMKRDTKIDTPVYTETHRKLRKEEEETLNKGDKCRPLA